MNEFQLPERQFAHDKSAMEGRAKSAFLRVSQPILHSISPNVPFKLFHVSIPIPISSDHFSPFPSFFYLFHCLPPPINRLNSYALVSFLFRSLHVHVLSLLSAIHI